MTAAHVASSGNIRTLLLTTTAASLVALVATGGGDIAGLMATKRSLESERRTIDSSLASIATQITSTESVLIGLEKSQRKNEEETAATAARVRMLRAALAEAEGARERGVEEGERLAEAIRSHTGVLQGLLEVRRGTEEEGVGVGMREEEVRVRLEKAKEACVWWVW